MIWTMLVIVQCLTNEKDVGGAGALRARATPSPEGFLARRAPRAPRGLRPAFGPPGGSGRQSEGSLLPRLSRH
jgi:hypothetical protein